MGTVHLFPGCGHARASVVSRTPRRKASIGTVPDEISLKRLAKPKDASLRPAKTLRKCESEHSAAKAKSLTDLPLASAQRSIGCDSDMGATISPRNAKSQSKIFPPEISLPIKGLLKCRMAKRNAPEPEEIFLGEWLDRAGIGPTEAAKIAGCSQSYISNISSGARTNINALFLLKLSNHLNITINDFFRRPPSESQIASLKALSPEAQEALLRPKLQKRR